MYFTNLQTVAEIKTEYKRLCFKYHPDVSGFDSTAQMQDINAAYLEALQALDGQTTSGSDGKDHVYNYDYAREVGAMDVIDNLLKSKLTASVEIELIGFWIWVSGTERKDKETRQILKDNGFLWHSKRLKWYWKPAGWKSYHAKNLDFDDLRAMYGGTKYRKQKEEEPRQQAPRMVSA